MAAPEAGQWEIIQPSVKDNEASGAARSYKAMQYGLMTALWH